MSHRNHVQSPHKLVPNIEAYHFSNDRCHILWKDTVFFVFHSEDFINRGYVETIIRSQIRQLYRSSASILAKFVNYVAPLPVVLRR